MKIFESSLFGLSCECNKKKPSFMWKYYGHLNLALKFSLNVLDLMFAKLVRVPSQLPII